MILTSRRSHPAAIKILGVVALLHNFCFWGVASMFPLYATSRLEFSEALATSRVPTVPDRPGEIFEQVFLILDAD